MDSWDMSDPFVIPKLIDPNALKIAGEKGRLQECTYWKIGVNYPFANARLGNEILLIMPPLKTSQARSGLRP